MTQAPILVLGATGKTGRRIVQRLSAQGRAVRQGSRRADPSFDWEDPVTWPAALDGVEAVYVSFYPDLAVPGAPAAIEALASCAAAAGVERLVLLSGRGEVNAQRCEEIVRASGIPFTLIRASWFAQNFDEGHLLAPVLGGTVALPAGEVREPFVDVDDIAEVAVAVLTDARHAGRLYEVTGPELANLLTDLCAEVLDGRNASLGDGVQQALGRAPRDFADYCRAAAASGAWNG
ncbi:MAG: NAD(P)H-binding protein [Rhodospirillales bacterium]|nr:NAD(P)H-binding protein [Rhodospirillales bacterium]